MVALQLYSPFYFYMKRMFMKLVCMTSLAATTVVSCQKPGDTKNNEDDLYASLPSSRVPAALSRGPWFSGTLSAISYFDRDGHRLGNDHEAGREFQFFETSDGKGRIRFWQYLGMRTYSTCVTEIFTQKEGSVVFEGDTFTFYPVKGSFKTIKDKCSSGNGTTTRIAATDELQPDTWRWELKSINGKPHLYTYAADDVNHEQVLFVYECAE